MSGTQLTDTAPTETKPIAERKTPSRLLGRGLRPQGWGGAVRYSGVLGTAILVLGFSLYLPGLFLSEVTLRTILSSQAVIGFLAIAALIPLAAGLYDLSFASVAGLSLLVTVKMSIETDLSMGAIIAIALLCAIACGLVSGLLVAFIKLDAFIVTLGMSSLVLGIAEYLTSGNTLYGEFDPAFTEFGRGSFGPIPYLFLALLVLSALVWLWLEHTPAGRYTLAVGSNPIASRLSGRSVARTHLLALIASALVAGIAGVLLASQAGVGATTTAPGYLLPALAALLLGATQVRERANVLGTLIAVMLLGTGIKGLQLAGADTWVTEVFNGGVLILAVAAAALRRRHAAVSR